MRPASSGGRTEPMYSGGPTASLQAWDVFTEAFAAVAKLRCGPTAWEEAVVFAQSACLEGDAEFPWVSGVLGGDIGIPVEEKECVESFGACVSAMETAIDAANCVTRLVHVIRSPNADEADC